MDELIGKTFVGYVTHVDKKTKLVQVSVGNSQLEFPEGKIWTRDLTIAMEAADLLEGI